jgi:threonylcarbamoyladenosine tRNA methylthiotransferase MtaB
MATFSIENFGCRATDSDAAALRHELLASGLSIAGDHSTADFVVLNTCTVTAAADSQAREAVRKIHRANPGARIVVTGCYAQRAPEELAEIEGVALVVGNSHQAGLPKFVRELSASETDTIPRGKASDFLPLPRLENEAMSLERGPAKILTGDIFAQADLHIAPSGVVAGDRTRPILKIQDGCNNRCAYCVIPFVRGRSRSLPPDRVVNQVRTLAAAGSKEVVLSGINLGSYGRDQTPRTGIADLVRRILDETEIQQLRFSSIEPQDVTEDLVALVASSTRLAPHFHVPIQSGSNRVLRAMRRWYRAEHCAERIKLIRRHLPSAGIGADVLVGFPGETDEDFRATAEFTRRLPFTYLHVFSFSARPGTEAAKMDGFVPPDIIRDRARKLRALGAEKAAAFRASQEGRTVRALTLARGGDGWTGALTGNYLKVRIAGRFPANEWRKICVPTTA